MNFEPGGRFAASNVTLTQVVPPGPPGPSTRPSDTTRSIVEMLPEQLGPRVEETTGPVETLVVESAEKP